MTVSQWGIDAARILTLASLSHVVRYLLVAAAFYLLLYMSPLRQKGSLRDPPFHPNKGQIFREILYSTRCCAVFGLSAVAIYALNPIGVTHIYRDWERYGTVYAWLTLPIMLVAFDTYFYWTHRLLHVIGVKRSTHDRHHASVFPTPWAALAFSVPEALVIATFFVLIATIMPIHYDMYRAFAWIVFAQSAMHHSSHEVYPASWTKSLIFKFVTTPHHHLLHHRYGRYNFGLYFTWWDRLLGTQHPNLAANQGAAGNR